MDVAFSSFVDDMFDILSKEDFNKICRKCLENLNLLGGIALPSDVENRIDESDNLSALFKVLCRCKQYWNWMNIRILEKMAGNSTAAKQLIKKYKNEVFSKKLKDVISEIPDLNVPKDKYTKVEDKWNKNFNDLTIGDVVNRWSEIEKKFNVGETMLLENIADGCVEVSWLLRNDLVERAIYSATNGQPVSNDQSYSQKLFPEVLFLKIGDVVIIGDTTSKLGELTKLVTSYVCIALISKSLTLLSLSTVVLNSRD